MTSANGLSLKLPAEALVECPELPWRRLGRGKVRDLFADGDRLLLVASDRISAFDVILRQGVPGKGILLTQIALAGFKVAASVVQHHLVGTDSDDLRDLVMRFPMLDGRSMLARKLEIVPVECVVRAHLAGSAWKAYAETGSVQGIRLPAGLNEGDALPEPIFTPTTKASAGHDQPLTPSEAVALLGAAGFEELRATSLAVFGAGSAWGRRAGLVLADTKFEFGRDSSGKLVLADEVFTPDSSRWWDSATLKPGSCPPGFDKQAVRDFLLAHKDWNRQPPAPDLTPSVVRDTQERYLEAWRRLAAAGTGPV